MVRKSILLLSVVTLTAVLLYAQDGKKSAEITGFLLDSRCASGIDQKDREHPVSCSLMPSCTAAGYTVSAKDTLYKLDDNGNKLALEILKTTKTKKRLAVKVVGTLSEGKLHVDTMEEVQ
jgi:hypothetical protein